MSRSATELLLAWPAGFAHRGRHGPGVPENSMAAFRAAIEDGAGIECDLRLSRDGEAMIFHDSSLERMCGLAGEAEALSAAELAALALGGGDETIPRLGDLLDLAGGAVPLLLELKAPAGSPSPPLDALCEAVAEAIASYAGPVGVMSFDPRVAAWFARQGPVVPRGLVIADDLPAVLREATLGMAGADFLAVEIKAAGRRWVARQRAMRPVACWTVRTGEERSALSDRTDALIWEGDGRP